MALRRRNLTRPLKAKGTGATRVHIKKAGSKKIKYPRLVR